MAQPRTEQEYLAAANAAYHNNDFQRAAQAYGFVLRHNPNNVAVLINYAAAMRRLGLIEVAEQTLRRAMALAPSEIMKLSNLGNILADKGDFAAAIAAQEQAVALDMNAVGVKYNLGIAYKKAGRLDEAIKIFQQVLASQPDHKEAHVDIAFCYLARGDIARGWPHYLKRTAHKDFRANLPETPRWQGEALHNKTLFVVGEQGLGDTIQFARYLPALAKGGNIIIAEAQPELLPLLQAQEWPVVWVPRQQQTPPHDVWVPLLDLFYYQPRSGNHLTDNVPYLQVKAPLDPPLEIARWQGLKIGVVWAGKASHRNDRLRSTRLSTMALLTALPQVRLYSLQVGARAKELVASAYAPFIDDLSPLLKDFAATAAALAWVDLVITVDTAVAHLAGALGKRVWVLLPQDADWRWYQDSSTSPWYPSMRLYRQTNFNDWVGVMQRVIADVQELSR